MKVLIDIPKEFEADYSERFAEFFQRCRADMHTCCGKYEHETAEMLEKAFTDSKVYDPDKVVEQLGERSREYNSGVRLHGKPEEMITNEAIEIVKGGGVNGN